MMLNTEEGEKNTQIKGIRDFQKEFPNFLQKTEIVEYCKIEKCKIETIEGLRVVKKGQIVPQTLREITKRYLEDLERIKVIKRSSSVWRNPIRALEKPDGTIRLVSHLIALNIYY
jgi:hypothetical protein